MRRGLLTLVACAAASGCSLVFPVDGNNPGGSETDKDGDEVPDAEDNCVGIPNPHQEDEGETQNSLPVDGIGDACDPNPSDDDDEVLHTFLFNEPATDSQDWIATGEWRWVKGYAEAAGGTNELIGMPLGLAPEKLVIEASFSMVDTPDMYAGLTLDPSCRGWIHVLVGTMRELGVRELGGNTEDIGTVDAELPPRFVLQVSRRMELDAQTNVKVWLRETDPIEDKSIPDTYAERGDGFGVWSAGGSMRVHHVVVYAGR